MLIKCLKYNIGIRKPRAILKSLRDSGQFEVPDKKQLNNHLSNFKKKKFGNYSLSLGELKEWVIKRTAIPQNIDQVYVPHHEINYDENAAEEKRVTLRVFFSTRRLLGLTQFSSHLNTDATWKMTFQGYPVFLSGTTDYAKRFHPYGLTLCLSEAFTDFAFCFEAIKKAVHELALQREFSPNVLVADGAVAITNGFTQAFGAEALEKRVMCWAHMIIKVDDRLSRIENENDRREIRSDIGVLQLARNESIFAKASTLFLAKWKASSADVKEFLG